MKKSKRILASFLALITVISCLPLGVLTAVATEDAESGNSVPSWTDEDYETLYVRDADGDGESDLKFKWDAFDKCQKVIPLHETKKGECHAEFSE